MIDSSGKLKKWAFPNIFSTKMFEIESRFVEIHLEETGQAQRLGTSWGLRWRRYNHSVAMLPLVEAAAGGAGNIEVANMTIQESVQEGFQQIDV